MNIAVKKLFICLSLLISVNAFAETVPIVISGKILDVQGNPVQGVRMIIPTMPLDQPSPLSIEKSLIFPSLPQACISYTSSTVVTDDQGVFTFKAKFSTDALVISMKPRRCSDFKDTITKSSLRLVPHPEDVKRFKLELASEALPFKYNSDNN